ncbi:hypothetical protein Trydic_g3941 [Trypoxylus dichotomus]
METEWTDKVESLRMILANWITFFEYLQKRAMTTGRIRQFYALLSNSVLNTQIGHNVEQDLTAQEKRGSACCPSEKVFRTPVVSTCYRNFGGKCDRDPESRQRRDHPLRWKSARIIPIQTPGKNYYTAEGYRPISLVSIFSTVLGALLLARVNDHLDEHHLLGDDRFAFRSGFPTTSQLFRTMDHVTTAFNRKQTAVVVVLDLEKEFHKICDEDLLLRMIDPPRLVVEFCNCNGKLNFESLIIRSTQQIVTVDEIGRRFTNVFCVDFTKRLALMVFESNITYDETWVHNYTSDSKQTGINWRRGDKEEWVKTKAKTRILARRGHVLIHNCYILYPAKLLS